MPETFAGLAGAGDLVATVTAPGSRNRRAGELLGQGVPAARIGDTLGQSSEALDGVGLLAETLRREGVPSPTLDRLAALVDGRIDSDSFTAAVTGPGGRFQRTEPKVTLATAGSGGTERRPQPGAPVDRGQVDRYGRATLRALYAGLEADRFDAAGCRRRSPASPARAISSRR